MLSNKPRVIAVVGLLLIALLAAGCGSGAGGGGAVNAQLRFGTGEAGGNYHVVGTALSKVIQDNLTGVKVAVEATSGGGLANIRLLANGDVDLGIAGTDAGFDAFKGLGQFKDKAASNLRLAWVGLPLTVHAIVLENSPVTKVADLKGKHVGTCSAGTETIYTPLFLKGFGINRADYKSTQMSSNEVVEALRDGRIDAIVCPQVAPAAGILDLASSRKLRFLTTDAKTIEVLHKENAWWSATVIAKGDYPGLPGDVATAGFFSAIFINAKVDENVVYQLTKVVLEHEKDLAAIHKSAGGVNVAQQKTLLSTGEPVPPLHPGVVKYYKEKGLLK